MGGVPLLFSCLHVCFGCCDSINLSSYVPESFGYWKLYFDNALPHLVDGSITIYSLKMDCELVFVRQKLDDDASHHSNCLLCFDYPFLGFLLACTHIIVSPYFNLVT